MSQGAEELNNVARSIMAIRTMAESTNEVGDFPRHEGYLSKYANFLKGWQTRFFVLETGVLYYFSDYETPSSRGSINLQTAVITISTSDLLRFDIDSGSQVFHLKARTAQERRKWISYLRRHKEVLSKLARRGSTDPSGSGSGKEPSRMNGGSDGAAGIPHWAMPDGARLVKVQTDVFAKELEDLIQTLNRMNLRKNSDPDHKEEAEGSSKEHAKEKSKEKSKSKDKEKEREKDHEKEDLEHTLDGHESSLHTDSVHKPMRLKGKVEKKGDKVIVDKIYLDEIYEKINRVNIAQCGLQDSTTKCISGMLEGEQQLKKKIVELEDRLKQYTFQTGEANLDLHQRDERVLRWTENVPVDSYSEMGTDVFYDAMDGDGTMRSEESGSIGELEFEDTLTGPVPETKSPSTKKVTLNLSPTTLGDGQSDEDGIENPKAHIFPPGANTKATFSQLKQQEHMPTQQGTSLSNAPSSIPTSPSSTPVKIVSSIFVPKDIPKGWQRRLSLPSNRPAAKEINIWNIFKDSVGKDLTKITIPTVFCEPITFLQRMAEDFEYSNLVDTAVDITDPFLRLAYVSVFSVSNYASTSGRLFKPLNPLLFETYECIRPDKGILFISEQVSHHPPVGAAYCMSDKGWWMNFDSPISSKFWGKSMEIHPLGIFHLHMDKTGEHYSWNKAVTVVNNIILSNRWVDHSGSVRVNNHKTGDYCIINFIRKGWFSGASYDIEGEVFDPEGNSQYELNGTWNESISYRPSKSNAKWTLIWQANARPPHSKDQYCFTTYTMQLNELDPISKGNLCPTDTRFRPDIRILEEGQMELSNTEKARLEDKQRSNRKEREKNGLPATDPIWFEYRYDEDSKSEGWAYKGGYFEARLRGDWGSNVPDLY